MRAVLIGSVWSVSTSTIIAQELVDNADEPFAIPMRFGERKNQDHMLRRGPMCRRRWTRWSSPNQGQVAHRSNLGCTRRSECRWTRRSLRTKLTVRPRSHGTTGQRIDRRLSRSHGKTTTTTTRVKATPRAKSERRACEVARDTNDWTLGIEIPHHVTGPQQKQNNNSRTLVFTVRRPKMNVVVG